jgi:hypothetical protein
VRPALTKAVLYAGASLAAVLATLLALAASSVIGVPVMLAAAAGAIALTILLLIPTDWLPSAALVVFLVVPRVALSVSDILSTVSPALLVLLVWYVKSWAEAARRRENGESVARVSPWAVITVLLLVLWIALLLLYLGPRATSLAWSFAFIVLALAIVLVPDAASAVRRLQSTFLWSSAVMGLYCVAEYLLGYNFLFERVNSLVNAEPLQHWAVYRAYGSLGHPLYAGLFFAMAFAVAFGRRFSGGGNRYLVFAGISMVGAVLTVSRSAVGAIAVTAGVIVLLSLVRRSSIGPVQRVFLALLVVGGVFAITQVSAFQDRLVSNEAAGSASARNVVLEIALQTAEANNWIGAGPAMALTGAAPYNPLGVIIESAYLQILISLGVPGLLLFALLLGAAAIRAVRVGAYSGLGAVVAFASCSAFFNILESSRPSLVLLGFALLMAWREQPQYSRARETLASRPLATAPAAVATAPATPGGRHVG